VDRRWTYAISVVGYAATAHGIANVVRAGVDAYMVGVTGAHPGDVIFLDDFASPLSESVAWLAYGMAAVGAGLWLTAYARNQRRRVLASVGADREG
jgi:hypothetical protein